MVKFTVSEILKQMKDRNAIRNISVIAHVDHGKTTLTDSLVARAGLMAQANAGKARFTDGDPEEQKRGITISSTGVSLYYEINSQLLNEYKRMKSVLIVDKKIKKKFEKLAKKAARSKSTKVPGRPSPEEIEEAISKVSSQLPLGEKYLINLIDSPGHVDFSSEVTAALRITDGALVVVDAVEGVCAQTETVLRQALLERIKPVLMINKIDRNILELKMDSEKCYTKFRKVIESANAVISTYQDATILGDLQVTPESGTVAFGSGLMGWAFTLFKFASFYSKKFGVKVEKFMGRLWGDYFWDETENKWCKTQFTDDGVSRPRGFVQFIWKPISQMFESVLKDDVVVRDKMLKSLEIQLTSAEKKTSGKELLTLIMKKWLPAADAMLEMVILHLPSPITAQKYRVGALYTGPQDDKAALSIASCDPEGPLMMYVSKMVPASTLGRFFAFGRVYSGTVRSGQKVRILGPSYSHGSKEDLFVQNIQQTVLIMGKHNHQVPSVPCGNLVGLVGVDQYLVKSGTITTDESAFPIATMKFSVSPVVRVAVAPTKPADIIKLVEGLNRLAKADPCVLHLQEETGEHLVCSVGELHLEICLKKLSILAGVPFTQSEPVVTYRETITEQSPVSLTKSQNGHNRIWSYSSPLSDQVIKDIETNKVPKDPKLRGAFFKDNHNWPLHVGRKIWCFGAEPNGTNMVVDETKSVQYLHEIREHVIAGFNWVARKGVLSEEELVGTRFNLVDGQLHTDSIHRGAGQISPQVRRVFYANQMMSKPRFLEPVFAVDIQVHQDFVGGIYNVLNHRGGSVSNVEPRFGTPLVFVKATLPVAKSFGFTKDLAAATSGRAFPTMSFSHYATVNSDPLEADSLAQKILLDIRKRKGIKVAVPVLSNYRDTL